MEEETAADGAESRPGPQGGVVVRTPAGWEASFGDRVVVGVYATEELAVRTVDLLRLKTAVDAGRSLDAVELQLPLGVSKVVHGGLLSLWLRSTALRRRAARCGFAAIDNVICLLALAAGCCHPAPLRPASKAAIFLPAGLRG